MVSVFFDCLLSLFIFRDTVCTFFRSHMDKDRFFQFLDRDELLAALFPVMASEEHQVNLFVVADHHQLLRVVFAISVVVLQDDDALLEFDCHRYLEDSL